MIGGRGGVGLSQVSLLVIYTYTIYTITSLTPNKGCEFISSSSETLVNHEQRCTFRPTDFKIIKKLNLHNLSRNTEMCIAEILQLLSQITIR